MKWVNDGIKYTRGNHEVLIARFDQKGPWFVLRPMATQQTQKAEFKRLAEYFSSIIRICEVKKMYNDKDNIVESDLVMFDFRPDQSCHFYRETTDGWREINQVDFLR